MTRPVFTALDLEWRTFTRSPEAARALRRWYDDPELRAPTLDDLVDTIWALPMLEADRANSRLAARAPADPTAARVLLQVLRPGLKTLGRRLALGASFDDVDHEVVAYAWERIRTYPFARRPDKIAANILLDVRKHYLRDLADSQACRRELETLPASRVPSCPSAEDRSLGAEVPSLQRAHDTLRRAIDGGSITAAAAHIIWQTRVVGVGDAEIADALGVGRKTLQRRRQRAERQLAVA